MAGETLPPAVRQLLSRYIASVEQLEILLLLRGQPDRAWTCDQVYEVIRSSQASVAQRLQKFTADGFLREEPGPPRMFRYAPKDGDLAAALDETATVYQTWRLRVIEAIFAPAPDPVQTFADAFKLRKD
ncbi:hypothetical protein BH20VER1_BH20VER1_26930 [soil metagenome]